MKHGMDLYFARHDGSAATCEDFVRAMEDANSRDLTQFRRWYEQAGTPEVRVSSTYDPNKKTFDIDLCQKLEPTAANTPREPMIMPLRFALFDEQGRTIKDGSGQHERSFVMTKGAHSLRLENIKTQPLLSIGRDFSAPVKIVQETPTEHLLKLLVCEDDDFNRFEAAQALYLRIIDDI